MILAGGEGKRMRSDRPKLLHTVGSKPMVEHVIRAAREAAIRDIIAVVGHRSAKLEPLMKRLNVATVLQDVQRGTGHAVLQAFPLLSEFEGDIVILSGDTPLIRAATIRHLLAVHSKHSNVVTFATAAVPNARGYGRIVRDRKGAFVRIVEEKDAGRELQKIQEINAGLYCFRAEPVLDALLMLTADNAQMEYYLPDAIGSIKARGGRVEAIPIGDDLEALGVNTQPELDRVRKIYARRLKHENNQRGMEDGVHREKR